MFQLTALLGLWAAVVMGHSLGKAAVLQLQQGCPVFTLYLDGFGVLQGQKILLMAMVMAQSDGAFLVAAVPIQHDLLHRKAPLDTFQLVS